MKAIKEFEYLYNNMTTSETIRLKPHLEVIEKEFLELLPEREETTKKLKAFDAVSDKIRVDFFIGLDNEYVYVLKSKANEYFMPITKEQYDILKEVLL